MNLTALHFLDQVMPLNQWMTVSEIAKAAKAMGIKNPKKDTYYSTGAIKSAISRSLERCEGLFETAIEQGRLMIKRVKNGCYDADVKQAMREHERKKSLNLHEPKPYRMPAISQKMAVWPKPGTLSQEVYTSQRVYL